jgi:hypothetical protein
MKKLLIMYFSPLLCYVLPLRSRYSYQHLVLKQPQYTLELQLGPDPPPQKHIQSQ